MGITAGGQKVLWLEDDIEGFEIASRKLSQQGLEVSLVSNVADFRAKLSEATFDLVIIDIRGETFNGLELVRDGKVDVGDAKVCFLSGYLDDPAIKSVLESLPGKIYVLDKSHPFDERSVEVGLEAQLRNILEKGEGHTNKTYFQEVDTAKFDREHGSTTYENYIALNASEKSFVKNAIVGLAQPEITKFVKQGYKWFLVSGPKGRIVEKSKEIKTLTSDEISQRSLAQGFPCVTEVRSSRTEEVRAIRRCSGMYGYYFTISMAFKGDSDRKYDIHFDSGSEASWFDLQFLKQSGIGEAGDTNASEYLHTMTGVKRVWYYSTVRQVALYDQPSGESPSFTTLTLRGVSEWKELSFSGASEEPAEELCNGCIPLGRCQARVGLLGQDLLREPGSLRLVLDGRTGLTTIESEEE